MPGLAELEREIDPDALDELRALDVVRGQPLVAVDCDEVMVEFSSHVARWLPSTGHEMRMTQYRLEGTMFPLGQDTPLPFDDCIRLLDRFFHEETETQEAVTGAVDALARLAGDARVIVLTNVPRFAGPARRRNLAALGMDFPVVVNTGGKGRALAWLAAQAAAPTAFIDDSPLQHGHASRHAPEVHRIHFVGAASLRELMAESPEAHHRAHDWDEAERLVRAALGL